jgi:ferritin-like metal-binding protein YciE
MKTKTKASRPAQRRKVNGSRESLETIFQENLRDIYWAEQHLTSSLPRLAKAANDEELKTTFDVHVNETKLQIGRIEKCFEMLELKPMGKKSEAMQGLTKEATRVISAHKAGPARDAALIAAAQKVEHYEISAYGTLRTMATMLGKVQCAELLEDNKDEVAEADETLTKLAEKINRMACEQSE